MGKKKKVNIVTMGCSKNVVDSEVLLSQLEHSNIEVAHDSDEVNFDAVVINTCGFINDAKEESISTILNYVDAKKQGDIGKLYVMGCLSERYKKDLIDEIPEVDRYFGKFDMKAITSELKAAYNPEYIYERKITTPSHFAYLKISEGCNRSCAFCAIPAMTGKHISKTKESLVKEATYLAKNGVKELLVIAQDLSYYGIDLYGKNQLGELLQLLAEIDGIEWIRLHYLYPTKFPFEILPIVNENPKVCKYLDLPLQHYSNPVLKRMLRHVTSEEIDSLIDKIKKEAFGVALRTTMLVGYPGETEEDFLQLLEFVKRVNFDRLGVFTYSHEDGTYAAKKYVDDVPEAVKQERANTLMEVQQQISAGKNAEKIGLTLKTIIDRVEGEYFVGRTEYDSSEVDGEVLVTASQELKIGEFYNVKITGSNDYDLFGVVG